MMTAAEQGNEPVDRQVSVGRPAARAILINLPLAGYCQRSMGIEAMMAPTEKAAVAKLVAVRRPGTSDQTRVCRLLTVRRSPGGHTHCVLHRGATVCDHGRGNHG